MALSAQSAEHPQKTSGFPIAFRSLVSWQNSKSHEVIFIPNEFCTSGIFKVFCYLIIWNKLSQKQSLFTDTFL